MIVKYAPSGGETSEWTYKAEDLPSSDAEDIEDAMGVTFDEYQVKLMTGGAKARRALLWVLLRRENKILKFENVSFKMGELSVDFDAEELGRIKDAIQKDKTISEAVREQALAAIEEQGPTEAPKERAATASRKRA